MEPNDPKALGAAKNLLLAGFASEVLAYPVINYFNLGLGLTLVALGGVLGIVTKGQTNDKRIKDCANWAIANSAFGLISSLNVLINPQSAIGWITALAFLGSAIFGLVATSNMKLG